MAGGEKITTSEGSTGSESPRRAVDYAHIPRRRYFASARGRALRAQIAIAGSIGFLLFGYDQGVLGGLNAAEEFLQQFNHPSSSLLGTINAIYEIGCCVGALIVFVCGETLGRKKCIYIGAVIMFIGAALQASSFGVAQMLVGRIICGLGNGFNTATTPLWLCELLPAKRRGRDVSTAGNLIAFGIIIAYYFNIGLSYTTGPVQWRLPIAFQGVFIILQLIWTKFLPESPRWLIKHGRHEEAIDILAQLQGKNVPCDAPTVIEQKRLIDEALALENEGGPWKFSEVFTNGPLKIRRRYIMVIGIQAMQQLAGINVLVYYAPHTLTTDMGFGAREALYVGAGIAVTYWLFSFSQVFFLDQMGRRRPLIVGGFLQALCFLCAGLLNKDVTPTKAKASLFFFFAYEAIFAVGWLAIPWLYPSEFMPLRHRTHSAAIATAADWIFNYMIVQITPISISNIRWKTYMIFFVINIAQAIIVWLFYPETSGRTLEEIDFMYAGDCDRLLVIGKNGRTLPGFRSMMNRPGNPEIGEANTALTREVRVESDKEMAESKSRHLETSST
ncbi:hypothetical protein EDD37DRAFT_36276 [Exophiala viscosa]|uniref:uncharacterized protein n=1 Tax=Exophiala viscosa TaxID=2486360 RepID=UPI00219934E6|nr:hypothetical protein EDD37DRAFT_36276 [Exophiala viscosa]